MINGAEYQIGRAYDYLVMHPDGITAVGRDADGYTLFHTLEEDRKHTNNARILWSADDEYVFVRAHWNGISEVDETLLFNYQGLEEIVDCVGIDRGRIVFQRSADYFMVREGTAIPVVVPESFECAPANREVS